MAKKRYLRKYNTQAEYHSDINNLPEIAVSVISGNSNVNYGTHYAVVINGSEAYFFEDGVIPEEQFADRDDIESVVIGSGITKINKRAFINCRNLYSVLIKGNMDIISEYVFRDCISLVSLKYYGTTEPTFGKYIFYNARLTYVEVNKNYSGGTFCDLIVDKVL